MEEVWGVHGEQRHDTSPAVGQRCDVAVGSGPCLTPEGPRQGLHRRSSALPLCWGPLCTSWVRAPPLPGHPSAATRPVSSRRGQLTHPTSPSQVSPGLLQVHLVPRLPFQFTLKHQLGLPLSKIKPKPKPNKTTDSLPKKWSQPCQI